MVTAALSLLAASPSQAQEPETPGSTTPPITVPSELPHTPPDFSVDASRAINAANETAEIERARERYPGIHAAPQVAPGRWEVFYSAGDERIALAVVDGRTGEVQAIWTGAQVAWQMARGNEGQFGHILNAPYVWLPLSAVFLLGLLDLRRLRRIVHLDLLVLLSFGVSHAYFNAAEIGVSVPLAYPPLLYLLARMLWIGLRDTGSGLRPSAPIVLLAVVATFLVGFRIAINIADSGVIDVGYAGVIGADRLTSGEAIYGAFPDDNPTGDTYGPANYFAYVPFELLFPWSGGWDSLPAAHAAAIAFDLLSIFGLLLLGRRLRPGRAGRDLGIVLAFAWVAYPYTAFALQSNSNDSLVAALVIWSLVAFASPVARSSLLALASLVKFAPLALVPLFAAGERGLVERTQKWRLRRPVLLRIAYFTTVFVGVSALLLIQPAVDPGLAAFWERTIGKQAGRESPFSIWGQVPELEPLQVAIALGVVALSVSLALLPLRRTMHQVAALAAALLIGTQLVVDHWFYLYIPWFFGLAMAGIAAGRVTPRTPSGAA